MASTFGAVNLAHDFIRQHVQSGDLCIDATAGRGHDTALLCRLCGPAGQVLAFDIQPEAVQSTRELLLREELGNARVILDSHSNLNRYAQPGSVSCIVFNFGWLPGGDHSIFTRAETSIAAIQQGMQLLKPDGVMSLCIYYGRDTGFAEKDALLEYVRNLDSRACTVIVHEFANRPNCPPIFVSIQKGL